MTPYLRISVNFDIETYKINPKIPGTCYFWKKKAPARQPRVVVRMGFQQKCQISILEGSGTLNLKPIIVDVWKVSETKIRMLFASISTFHLTTSKLAVE